METRRIQDKAPPRIRDLITLRLSKYTIRNDYILSLPKVNSTKYSLILWRYFAAEKWSELPNDIKIKAGSNEVKSKIRLLKLDFYQNF